RRHAQLAHRGREARTMPRIQRREFRARIGELPGRAVAREGLEMSLARLAAATAPQPVFGAGRLRVARFGEGADPARGIPVFDLRGDMEGFADVESARGTPAQRGHEE